MTMPVARPRRSALYMPASNAKAIEKARTLPCDVVILDLEDAVAPEAKEAARAMAVEAVRAGGFNGKEVVIRINGEGTPWGDADLEAAIAAGPDAVLVPKVNRGSDVVAYQRRIGAAPIDLWAMVETTHALFNLYELAAAAEATRLTCFVMGTNDLVKETGARLTPGREPLLGLLGLAVAAARSQGLTILDGVFNDIEDLEGLDRECGQGRDFGFDGKTLIHPKQIETCNTAFTPAAGEVAFARAVVAAFAREENAEKGVIRVEGKMTERLHLAQAERLLDIIERIEGLTGPPATT